MVETLLLPFSYGYMTNAMWVSALVGGVCAFLSAYLVLKGWSLIGDALSHSIVPGVALTSSSASCWCPYPQSISVPARPGALASRAPRAWIRALRLQASAGCRKALQ